MTNNPQLIPIWTPLNRAARCPHCGAKIRKLPDMIVHGLIADHLICDNLHEFASRLRLK